MQNQRDHDRCVGRQDLERLHAGELPAERAAEVEGHLRECAACGRLDAQIVAEHEAMLAELGGLASLTHGDGAPVCGAHADGPSFGGAAVDADETAPSRPRLPANRWPELPGYEIVGEISRGGQGVVYEAIQEGTNREVAIKVLLDGAYASPTARRRFEREIELVGSLRHASIVSVFHSGVTPDGRPFCVMDFVRGVPLNRYVREKGLTLRQTLALFAEVCDGVQYAHHKGIIHRDLKPSNVFVEEPFPATPGDDAGGGGDGRGGGANGDARGLGVPKILDFGLARHVVPGASITISDSRQVLGTLPYMSPEQARGATDEIDTRTDVYSLGVMLYELLTGRYPYPVDGPLADVLRHIQETPPTPPSRAWSADSGVASRREGRRARRRLPRLRFRRGGEASPIDEEVRTIVMRALSKERSRRYQTALGLGRDLRRYLAGEAIEARRDSLLYVMTKRLRRYQVGAAVCLAGVLGVLVVAWAISTLQQRIESERQARLRESARVAEAREGAERQRASLREEFEKQLDDHVMVLDGDKLHELLPRAEEAGVDRSKLDGCRAFVATIRLNWDDALVHANSAISADPDNRVALYLRAVNHGLHNRMREAIYDYAQATSAEARSTPEIGVKGVMQLLLFDNEGGIETLDSLRQLHGRPAGIFLRGFGRWFVLLRNPPLAIDARWQLGIDAQALLRTAAATYEAKLPFIDDALGDLLFRLGLLADARGDAGLARDSLEQSRLCAERLRSVGAAGAADLNLAAHALLAGDLPLTMQLLESAYVDLSDRSKVHRINAAHELVQCALLRLWVKYLMSPGEEARSLLERTATECPDLSDTSGLWLLRAALGVEGELETSLAYDKGIGLWMGYCLRRDWDSAETIAGRIQSPPWCTPLTRFGTLGPECRWRETLVAFVQGTQESDALLAAAEGSAARFNWSQLARAMRATDPAARQAALREIVAMAHPDVPWAIARGLVAQEAARKEQTWAEPLRSSDARR